MRHPPECGCSVQGIADPSLAIEQLQDSINLCIR